MLELYTIADWLYSLRGFSNKPKTWENRKKKKKKHFQSVCIDLKRFVYINFIRLRI